jgi:hypothetical protein
MSFNELIRVLGMAEHISLLQEQRLPIPPANPNPRIVIQNAQRQTAA